VRVGLCSKATAFVAGMTHSNKRSDNPALRRHRLEKREDQTMHYFAIHVSCRQSGSIIYCRQANDMPPSTPELGYFGRLFSLFYANRLLKA